MKKITISIFLLFCTLNLFALEKAYILPKDTNKAFETMETLIKNSKEHIDIAVYNFEYKKIAKLLKKAAKKGVKINIIFEHSKLKNKKSKYEYLCNEKNIECKIEKKQKQHIKLMVFDKQTAMFGSANLTKESFGENLELLYFTDAPTVVKKLNTFFNY